MSLKPCPFCGGEILISTEGDYWAVCSTPDCAAITDPDHKKARERWNVRPGEAAARLDAARKMEAWMKVSYMVRATWPDLDNAEIARIVAPKEGE